MDIEVAIDEIVLYGTGADAAGLEAEIGRLESAVSAELGRLIARRGLPATLGRGSADLAFANNTAKARGAGEARKGPGGPIDSIGGQIAQAVYGGLDR
jgi:hypothetical protein